MSTQLAKMGQLAKGLQQSVATAGADSGSFMKFTKFGAWVHGAEDVEVEEGSTWAIHPEAVTFDDAEYEKRYPTADLYLVRSTDGGKMWSTPRQVNEVTKQAPEALHWMAVAPRGEVHVAWLDRRDREQSGQDIYYSTVVDGEVGTNVKVARTVCECCAPGLAIDAAGCRCYLTRHR